MVSSTHVDRLQSGWVEAQEGLRFALNFLRSNAGIEEESLLSSPMFVIALAAIGQVKDNRLDLAEQHQLMQWLLIANARGRYSRGSTETLLNEDLNVIFRGGGMSDLSQIVKRQFGRLAIEPDDLAGRGVNSPLFSLAYLALKDAGAQDWNSGLGLSLSHQGKQHLIQWHHIFPKSLLKDREFETREINEIANMAFIGGQTNRRISNKHPVDYLPEIVARQGSDSLALQCVPADQSLWPLDAYLEFLKTRRELLAARMNAFIASKSGKESEGHTHASSHMKLAPITLRSGDQ